MVNFSEILLSVSSERNKVTTKGVVLILLWIWRAVLVFWEKGGGGRGGE